MNTNDEIENFLESLEKERNDKERRQAEERAAHERGRERHQAALKREEEDIRGGPGGRRRSRSRESQRVRRDRHDERRDYRQRDRDHYRPRERSRSPHTDSFRTRREDGRLSSDNRRYIDSYRPGLLDSYRPAPYEPCYSDPPKFRKSSCPPPKFISAPNDPKWKLSKDLPEDSWNLDPRNNPQNRGNNQKLRYNDRRRSRTPPPSKPKLTDDERDRRTVFVQQLAGRAKNKHLMEFFSSVGAVTDASVVQDKVTKRSKGVGYVEFRDEESVQKAIQLTGQKLLDIPVIVQHTEAEKNRLAKQTDTAHNGNANGIPFHRLYVGNIHFNVEEKDLESVFEPFGELEFVQLQKEDGVRSKGYGFVQYRNPENAKAALEAMNGFELAGRIMRVGLGNDKFTAESTQNFLRGHGDAFTGSSFSGAGGRGAPAGGSGHYSRNDRDREKANTGAGASALDDTDVAGVNFNSYSRDALMKKLSGTDDHPADHADNGLKPRRPEPKKPAAPEAFRPCRCIKIENAFNPADEEGDEWIAEIEADVRSEADAKYGKVKHLAVDRNSAGEIYIKFAEPAGGLKALQSLQGRNFGGRMLTARPVVDAIYHSMFPAAKNL